MAIRFVGKAKSQHVDSQHPVLLDQVRPHLVEIPRSARKAMDQQKRGSVFAAVNPEEDLMPP